jgi:hypothetical protein
MGLFRMGPPTIDSLSNLVEIVPGETIKIVAAKKVLDPQYLTFLQRALQCESGFPRFYRYTRSRQPNRAPFGDVQKLQIDFRIFAKETT